MPEQRTLHLPERYAAQVRALLQQHIPEAEVWAYGSRVRGDHYAASDLDLVVRFPSDSKPTPLRLSDVKEAFVESNLPLIVQLVAWSAIPESFREEILAGYVVLQRGQAQLKEIGHGVYEHHG
ncbi:predicted nucleotidyltransferase [Serpentinimonas raichei]|jgi:predicted nucleotidyltransferase|uniref:Predicted nucleotidyltransferase n=1 Tax=Serpentinimonas raichei TaxID=1458425 RepID=A0A060NKC8_9BURK|nr:nucleotidyltransferase domain-containing protein [Serpentinimonas raichei]BAO81765.1 predicted nucleotidyltransferase [Serpentinimonas raichei]